MNEHCTAAASTLERPAAGRLATLASDIEAALAGHFAGQIAGDYRAKLRAIAASIKLPDGVAVALLTGELSPAALPRLGPRDLASAAERRRLEEREAKRRVDERAWEDRAGISGGTYAVSGVECPQCRCDAATVHSVLSGGTYAQERVLVQKYVCRDCSHTWRMD